jgi:hypothetical protein
MERRNLDVKTQFILENYDEEFTNKLYDAILDVATDKDTGEGDTRKTFCSLACIVSTFMEFCSEHALKPDLTPEKCTGCFFSIVDTFTNMGEDAMDIIKDTEEREENE